MVNRRNYSQSCLMGSFKRISKRLLKTGDPVEKGDKNENGRVVSLESVPTHLNSPYDVVSY